MSDIVGRLRDMLTAAMLPERRETVTAAMAEIEQLRDLLHRWHVCYSHDEESDLATETRAALEGKQ